MENAINENYNVDGTYTIKEDYRELWGSTVDENTEVSFQTIEFLAKEWDCPLEKLMEQVEEVDDDTVDNEAIRDQILSKIEKLTVENGGHGDIACTSEAYHGCWPNRPNGWDAPAVQIQGNMLHEGRACWDFDEHVEEYGEPEDAGDYPWDNEPEFVINETFDLTDEDDMKFVMELLEI
jgi:hypothetical protein